MLTKFAVTLATLDVLSVPEGANRAARRQIKKAHRHTFKYTPRAGYLYVRSRAISSRCNDNFDEFPAEEIEKSFRSFIGKPVFVNHHNEDHRRKRGVIIDAALHRDVLPTGAPDVWCEVLMEVDAKTFPRLAKAIIDGDIDRTSMGCDVEYSICSICGNKATSPAEYCQHIPRMKGQRVWRTDHKTGKKNGVLVREICYGLRFFENSLLVEDPADPTAVFTGVDTSGLDKAASKTASHGDDDERVYLESLHGEPRRGPFDDEIDASDHMDEHGLNDDHWKMVWRRPSDARLGDDYDKVGDQVEQSFRGTGTSDAGWLLDQQPTGPTKYSTKTASLSSLASHFTERPTLQSLAAAFEDPDEEPTPSMTVDPDTVADAVTRLYDHAHLMGHEPEFYAHSHGINAQCPHCFESTLISSRDGKNLDISGHLHDKPCEFNPQSPAFKDQQGNYTSGGNPRGVDWSDSEHRNFRLDEGPKRSLNSRCASVADHDVVAVRRHLIEHHDLGPRDFWRDTYAADHPDLDLSEHRPLRVHEIRALHRRLAHGDHETPDHGPVHEGDSYETLHHHRDGKTFMPGLGCPHCDAGFYNADARSAHIKENHPGQYSGPSADMQAIHDIFEQRKAEEEAAKNGVYGAFPHIHHDDIEALHHHLTNHPGHDSGMYEGQSEGFSYDDYFDRRTLRDAHDAAHREMEQENPDGRHGDAEFGYHWHMPLHENDPEHDAVGTEYRNHIEMPNYARHPKYDMGGPDATAEHLVMDHGMDYDDAMGAVDPHHWHHRMHENHDEEYDGPLSHHHDDEGPHLASLAGLAQHFAAADERQPEGYLLKSKRSAFGDYWAVPSGKAPYEPMDAIVGLKPKEEGHGPWHLTRHPETRAHQVVDNQNRLTDSFPGGDGDGQGGYHHAKSTWIRYNQAHGHLPVSEGDDLTKVQPWSVHSRFGHDSDGNPIGRQEAHWYAPPPPFEHSTEDPRDSVYRQRAADSPAPVRKPSGHGEEGVYAGPHEVVQHPETGRFHVVDRHGRQVSDSPWNGFETQDRAEWSKDYSERRSQSRQKGREMAERIFNSTMEVLDPGGTPESRQSERRMDTASNLMNRYSPEHIKYDPDDEPYAVAHHPTGWEARDYGGANVHIYHRATGEQAHDLIDASADGGEGSIVSPGYKPIGYGHKELKQDLHNWVSEVGDDYERNTPEIQRWKRGRR